MEFKELIEEVSNIIQDPFFDDKIGDRINRGIKTIAAGVLLPGKYDKTPPLPELYTTSIVTTEAGAVSVPLPADYGRSVVMVINESGDEIPIQSSFRSFLKDNPTLSVGSIRTCTVKGKDLLYRDVPSSTEDLTLHYYKIPELLEDEDESPDCIPEHLHYSLLVSFAAKEIFNLIEDGISSQKINTQAWSRSYLEAVHELGVYLGEDGKAFNYSSYWD